MAGKKGMAWSRFKNPSEVKQLSISVADDDGIIDYILSVAQDHKWSMSQATREIILAAKNSKVKI